MAKPKITNLSRRAQAALLADQLLASTTWAHTLNPRERERVRADLTVRSFEFGALIVSKGTAVEHWIGVAHGLVKINSVSREGKTVTFTGVPAGGWLGEGSLLKPEPRKYDVVALRESTIVFMPRRTFRHLLDTNIAFNQFLLRQLNERLGQFIAMVEYYRLLGPDARVARCMAELFNPVLYPGENRRLEISQEEIGYLAGISRQRANQALQRLAANRLLRIEYGAVEIIDRPGLRTFTD
jgi:CRP/FNR family transcriptional regulator, cyclic AMP receptor protein